MADVPTLEAQWRALRERTYRPFAINHTIRPFDEDAFAATLRFRPAAISFHIGVRRPGVGRPGHRRARAAGRAARGPCPRVPPFAGQSVALVHDVLPAAQIVRELVEGAEAALATAARRPS